MGNQELTYWSFERELMEMAESCIGLKKETARKKARNIFKKYQEIISRSKDDKEWYENAYNKINNKYNALKNGYVSYVNTNSKMSGVLLLKDIEQVEVSNTGVLLITKSGREIRLGSDFAYLLDLLK